MTTAPAAVTAPVRRALPVIVRFEGLRLRPYLCPAGVPSVGLGSTRYLDGRPVRLTDPPITREHAYTLAVEQLRREYLPAVLRLCPGIDGYDRLAGVLSFTYNVGAGALQASTLRRRINAGDWAGAQVEMRKWNKAGGKILPGLVTRRAIEAGMLA